MSNKETIQDLIESVIENKPRDTKEIFNTLMAEKIREAVAQHAEVVAESFFDESEETEEFEESESEEDEDLEEGAFDRGKKFAPLSPENQKKAEQFRADIKSGKQKVLSAKETEKLTSARKK